MTTLSPAAHAVVQAAHAVAWVNTKALAAALCAAADQIQMKEPFGDTDADAGVFAAHQAIHDGLLAIAAELEGAQ